MAKPRTFISSTCFDLKDARARLKAYLGSIGHEPLLSDDADFGVTPGSHSHQACLDQVDNSDFMVLIVGGRRGGTFVGSEASITNEEWRRAVKRGMPVLIFVKKSVDEQLLTFKKNTKGDFKHVVDDVRVFDFIDLIKAQSEDNWVRPFETVEDIVAGLRAQFAYLHLLYSQQHRKRRDPKSRGADAPATLVPFPVDLSGVGGSSYEQASTIRGLRNLHRIISVISGSGAAGIQEKIKLLWVVGRRGAVDSSAGDRLTIDERTFKQFAWSTSKGEKVNKQLESFDVRASYEVVEEFDGPSHLELRVGFKNDRDGETAGALIQYVRELAQRHGDDGLELFARGDMSTYSLPLAEEKEVSPRPAKAKNVSASDVKRKPQGKKFAK